MGTLTYMYYQGFIATHMASVGGVIEMAIIGLTLEEQMEVIKGLSKHLVNQGVLTDSVSLYICEHWKLKTDKYQVMEYLAVQPLTLKRR